MQFPQNTYFSAAWSHGPWHKPGGVSCWLCSLCWSLLPDGCEVLAGCTAVQSWRSPPRGSTRLHRSKAESPTMCPCSRRQRRGPQATCTSDLLVGNPMTSSRVLINCNDSQNSGNVLLVRAVLVIKDQSQDQPQEEAPGQGLGGPQMQHSVLCPMGSGHIPLSHISGPLSTVFIGGLSQNHESLAN